MKKLSIFSAQKYFYFVYLLIRCEYLTHFINNFNKIYAYLISFLQLMSIILCGLWYNCYHWQSHMNGNDLDFLNKYGKVHINKKRYYLIQALPHPMLAKSSILLQTTWCQSFAFTEFDFYKDYEESFKKCEIGRIVYFMLKYALKCQNYHYWQVT